VITATAAMLTALQNPEGYDWAVLMNFDFSTGNERISTLPRDVPWNSFTWEGSAGVVQLGRWSRSSETALTQFSVVLAVGPAHASRVTDVLTASRRRNFRAWYAALDRSDGGVVDDPIQLMKRQMVPGAVRGGSTYTVEIVMESILNQSRVRAGRTASHAEQRLVDATDFCLVNLGDPKRGDLGHFSRPFPKHG